MPPAATAAPGALMEFVSARRFDQAFMPIPWARRIPGRALQAVPRDHGPKVMDPHQDDHDLNGGVGERQACPHPF